MGASGHTWDMERVGDFPEDAFAPNGLAWWDGGARGAASRGLGQAPRLAAWLWFNKGLGDEFSMNELRDALGPEIVGKSEHLNRRLRELRAAGWVIPSGKDVGGPLGGSGYRLDGKGVRIWLPEERRRVARFAPSAKIRRRVLERDGSRCVVCGIGAGEPYPGEPNRRARLTLGHRVPQERLRQYGEADNLDNWRTECAQCNETVRDEAPDPLRYEEVWTQVRALGRADKGTLGTWLRRGERVRSDLDRVYDLVRTLSTDERERLITALEGFPRAE